MREYVQTDMRSREVVEQPGWVVIVRGCNGHIDDSAIVVEGFLERLGAYIVDSLCVYVCTCVYVCSTCVYVQYMFICVYMCRVCVVDGDGKGSHVSVVVMVMVRYLQSRRA